MPIDPLSTEEGLGPLPKPRRNVAHTPLAWLYEWCFRDILDAFEWPQVRIDAFVREHGNALCEPSSLFYAFSPMSHVAAELLEEEFSDLRRFRNEKLSIIQTLASELELVMDWERARRERHPPRTDWRDALPQVHAKVKARGGRFRDPSAAG